MDPKRREDPTQDVRERYDRISGSMNELSKRLWAGNESISIGYGGIGIVRNTVVKGRNEIITRKNQTEGSGTVVQDERNPLTQSRD